jgi:hypothetical protein
MEVGSKPKEETCSTHQHVGEVCVLPSKQHLHQLHCADLRLLRRSLFLDSLSSHLNVVRERTCQVFMRFMGGLRGNVG